MCYNTLGLQKQMVVLVEINNIPIQEISTCAILVPLLLAASRLKTGDFKIRLFFLFLLYGALVDGYGWFVYSTDRNPVPHSILQYSYLFFEAIFFVWLCTEFLNYTKAKVLRTVFYVLLFGTFLFKGFGSFFIDIMVKTGLFINLWKLRNYVNIIQYGFFCIGILKINRSALPNNAPYRARG